MDLLSLQYVSYRYSGAENYAVKNVTYGFNPGKMYAITGSSGSGKSTLLSLLAGMDMPTEGMIAYDNEDLRGMDLDRYRREEVSMIFQSFLLLPLLTVTENVCYPIQLVGNNKKAAVARAEECLKRVGISGDKLHRFPSRLSGGEQQRVAIARSLASCPRILLADEPTGNLDSSNSEMITKILSELALIDGLCVIVATHDREVAGKADVVLQMKDGILTEAR